jgi:hypothetical protein
MEIHSARHTADFHDAFAGNPSLRRFEYRDSRPRPRSRTAHRAASLASPARPGRLAPNGANLAPAIDLAVTDSDLATRLMAARRSDRSRT